MNKDKFLTCFNARRTYIEQRYPDAFGFMGDGLDFTLFMVGIFFLYFWVISPQIDKLLGSPEKEVFDYGAWLKDFGKAAYGAPEKIYNAVKGTLKK